MTPIADPTTQAAGRSENGPPIRSAIGPGAHDSKAVRGPKSHRRPAKHAKTPDIDLGGSGVGVAGQALYVFERRIQELPEAERKALKRRAQSRLGLWTPSQLPERDRDSGLSR